jgi:hypothetical protein
MRTPIAPHGQTAILVTTTNVDDSSLATPVATVSNQLDGAIIV